MHLGSLGIGAEAARKEAVSLGNMVMVHELEWVHRVCSSSTLSLFLM